jgi:hypothetical protein
MDVLKALMIQWYQTLSRLSVALTVPASDLADRVDLPLVSGAVAPCQLTTNASAMAYVSSRLGHGRPGRDALAYVFARVLVYTALGAVVVLVGRQLEAAAIPVVMAARKVLGPLMIVLGLGFLGVLRLRGSVGRRVSGRLEARVPSGGVSGAFLLGGRLPSPSAPRSSGSSSASRSRSPCGAPRGGRSRPCSPSGRRCRSSRSRASSLSGAGSPAGSWRA